MKAKILIGAGLVTLTLAGGAVAVIPKESKIELVNPQTFEWVKPVTDEQWNEDVKLEYVDIRGTATLEKMAVAQREKLKKNKKAFERYDAMIARGIDPVDVLYTEFYEQFRTSFPNMKDAELEAEAQNAAVTKYSQEKWEIERITQGIERIDKELEMRDSGFVKVKGEKVGVLDFFGAEVPPDRIREPID
jgi:hypothetical protein